jgi:hypothetical protein
MRRRDFIKALQLGSGVAGHARQSAMPVIGVLIPTSPDTLGDRLRAFRRGLAETGLRRGPEYGDRLPLG